MKKFLLFMLGVLVALPGIARSFSYTYEGKTLIYTVIDEDAKTCKTNEGYYFTGEWEIERRPGNNISGELVIPSVAKDGDVEYAVTEIGTLAFIDLSGLTSVTIPNSVTSIGKEAFSCTGLTSVTIPNSVTEIGGGAFNSCTGLTSVTIPNSVTEIGDKTFNCCWGLTSVNIPNSVTSIGKEAFCGCTALTSIEIPESVASIGGMAFYGCSAITLVKATAVNPPAMNDNSFQELYAIAALSVPEDAVNNYLATNWSLFKNIRVGGAEEALKTFETGNLKYRLIPAQPDEDKNLAVVIPGDYSSLTEVTIPERFTVSDNGKTYRYFVDAIGYKAFNGCSNLATVTFNSRNTARMIGDYAFAGTKILTITMPETVEAIGDYAFSKCQSLTGIVIPGSTETIGKYAFNGCSNLATVTFNSPNIARTIGAYAFNECSLLSSIEIPGSVKTIGDYAFYRTSKLGKVTFNEGLESIGEYAFSASSDRNIEPINIPSTLKSVGKEAFYNFNCEYVNIPDLAAWCNIDFENENSNPAAHRQGLYLNGEKIEDLVIPESVNAIKNYAFCYNSTLKSVKFNEALQSVGANAFRSCGGLTTAAIPGNVTAIGDNAFASTNVKNLTLAYGPEQIEIGTNAFPALTSLFCDRALEGLNLNVSRLDSLTIGNSVAEIPAAKFKGLTNLNTLTLGNSVTTIGDEAFSGCTGLTEVILPPSVETIGASAFAGNSKLTSITMGHNVSAIGEKAFDLCPAQTVSITAQTPPDAPDNTFSNYTGSLYVQGKDAVEAYYDADYCWYQFEGHVMIEPTGLDVEGGKTLTGKPGDTFQLTATLYPTDVTLPHIFWRSTNPDIATVDANGLVTLHADMNDVMAMAADNDSYAGTCKIIAESLYADGPVAEVTVNTNSADIDDIVEDSPVAGEIDFSAPVEIYNLQGIRMTRNLDELDKGIYIVRQGKNVKKIAVK